MSRRVSTTIRDVVSTESGWTPVLSDVQKEMASLRKRLGDLSVSEAIIKKKISANEPLPQAATSADSPLKPALKDDYPVAYGASH